MAELDSQIKPLPGETSADGSHAESLVSVIIPTYNSAKTLGKCLDSIKNQTHSNVEIIVVDSSSSDETTIIADRHGALVLQIEGVPNLKRNHGISQSKGRYLLLLDSDMVLERNAIGQCIKGLDDLQADALDLTEESIALNFWAECIARNRGSYEESGVILPRFFRSAVLKGMEMDPQLLYGDDYAHYLHLIKNGFRIAKTGAVVKHYESTSLKAQIKRNYHAYKSLPYFMRKFGVGHTSFRTRAFFKSTVAKWIFRGLFLRDPHHFAGLVFLKLLVVISALAGTIAGFVGSRFQSH